MLKEEFKTFLWDMFKLLVTGTALEIWAILAF